MCKRTNRDPEINLIYIYIYIIFASRRVITYAIILAECAWLFRIALVNKAGIHVFMGHGSLENVTYAM